MVRRYIYIYAHISLYMSDMVDKTTIVVPVSVRDKLVTLKVHPRQPLWEVIKRLTEVTVSE